MKKISGYLLMIIGVLLTSLAAWFIVSSLFLFSLEDRKALVLEKMLVDIHFFIGSGIAIILAFLLGIKSFQKGRSMIVLLNNE